MSTYFRLLCAQVSFVGLLVLFDAKLTLVFITVFWLLSAIWDVRRG